MSTDTEIERKICDFLRRNGKSTALIIVKEIGPDKRTVNKHLYNLERSNQVFKTDGQPPVWVLMEKKNEIKQTLKPQQKSPTTRDTSEEKEVEDLLRSGGLKAHQIARDLRQSRQTINKQLYSMEKKNEIKQTLKPEQKSPTTRDTSEEKEVEDLLRSGGLKAHQIARDLRQSRQTINKQLYSMEKKNEIKQTLKPQQKSPTTRDTSEEKEVEDLLRSGGLKAHQIARDLRQSRQTINKQLYSMEKKGTVKKCSKSSMWRLTEDWSDDSFSQERFVLCVLLKILTVVTYNDYLVCQMPVFG